MTKVLTIELDAALVEKIERYADKTGDSVDQIVGKQLSQLVKESPDYSQIELTPRIKRLSGILTLPQDYDYKEDLANILAEKHNS